MPALRAFLVVAVGALLLLLLLRGVADAQFNGDFEVGRRALSDENYLDWKAYQFPIMWRYEWYTARNALRASVGSLTNRRFYMLHDIKLQADLGQMVSFLYLQDSESFGRDDGIYQEAELRVGDGVYGSLLGWVAPEKRFDNVGVALSYGGREDQNLLRVSYLRQFAEYNERSTAVASSEGRYARTPDLYRIEARTFWNERLFLSLHLTQESPAEFEEAETGITRRYEGEEVNAVLDWWGAERDWLAGASLWGDRERRSQSTATPSETAPALQQRMEWYAWEVYGWRRLAGGDHLTFGLADSGFSNHISSGQSSERFRFAMTTTQLFTRWEPGASESPHWLFSVQAGQVDSRQFNARDPASNRDETSLQAKGGTGLVVQETGRHRFLFLATWDLDSFYRRPWDGGSVQLQIVF